MNKKAILHCRVSTDEQAEKGYSLRDQEERLKAYCAVYDLEIIKVIREDHSAKSFIRPEFERMLTVIKQSKNQVDYLLFLKWDRFSRNAPDAYEMLRKLKKYGVNPIATELSIDFSIPEQKFMLAFYLTAPEVENDRRSINVTQGMRRAKLEGKWPSKAPLGYTNTRDENNQPIFVPDEKAKHIKDVFIELSRNRYTIEYIRKDLVKKGIVCSKTNFHKLIRNPIYMGKIRVEAYDGHPEEIVDGRHESIISRELYYKVQDILEQRRVKNAQPLIHIVNEHLPVRGMLICPDCGKKLTGSASRGNGGRFYYYHCKGGCKVRYRAERVNESVQQMMNNIKVDPVIKELYRDVVNDYLKNDSQARRKKQKDIDKNISILKNRIQNLENKYADNEISSIEFSKMHARFIHELDELEAQIKEVSVQSKDVLAQIEFCSEIISDIGKLYTNADVELKRQIIGSTYPENLIFSKNKSRTVRVNEVIKLLSPSTARFELKEKGQRFKYLSLSSVVNQGGVEPPTS